MSNTVDAERYRAAIAASGLFDGFTLRVRVSRRRSFGVTVEPGGAVLSIAVPVAASPEDTVTALGRMRHRIASSVNRAREFAPDFQVVDLVNGQGFTWLGRPARLRVLDGRAPVVRVQDGHGWWIHAGRDLLAREGTRPLIRWYCAEGTEWAQREAPALWSRIASPGTSLPVLRAADIGRKRWGKYEPARHRVTLAWQTLQLPAPLARYVLAHELTHAARPAGAPHGREFWRMAERALPGAREEQQRLDREGGSVWMGDVRPS
ncbi:YgjP-like metallopeptidase domain-containing protein [Streptomyces rubiginosohelvolus]|uniref:YgjP-like metallopeptidase domain-containing protein n=1 Tax=Streptomyces rubiginosohelvolus TaxID=67362 RepID=UPI0035DF4413